MSSTPSAFGPLQISGFITRLSSLTHTEFSTHWLQRHAPIVVPWCLKYNIVAYTQTHLHPKIQAEVADKMKMPLLQYDGFAQMTLGGNVEEFMGAFKHPYYLEVIAKDEKRFLDQRSLTSGESGSEDVAKGATGKGWENGATAVVGSPVDIILDGKAKIDVPEAVWEEWRKWDDK
ncbi:hypothetical protein FRB95_013997 [Tulasnella sp. JGI-2019a]|nr:hypothetical protein FRB95_013997 [Tulasnella sp. JGI-2019a]